jgi:carboxymethylenebutenolidase
MTTFSSNGQAVTLDVFPVASAGKHPAVLILHGSFGMMPQYKPDIVSFADALLAAGIASAMPYYLESTRTQPGLGVLTLISEKSPTWRQACSDALTVMAGDARFDSTRLGILGFSLGGHLALSLAMDPPAGINLKCVVDFFGPTQTLEPHWSKMPPVLVFHGSADTLVYPSESEYLVGKLDGVGKKKGVDYFYDPSKGETHGFKGAELTKSRDATVEFFKKRL